MDFSIFKNRFIAVPRWQCFRSRDRVYGVDYYFIKYFIAKMHLKSKYENFEQFDGAVSLVVLTSA